MTASKDKWLIERNLGENVYTFARNLSKFIIYGNSHVNSDRFPCVHMDICSREYKQPLKCSHNLFYIIDDLSVRSKNK